MAIQPHLSVLHSDVVTSRCVAFRYPTESASECQNSDEVAGDRIRLSLGVGVVWQYHEVLHALVVGLHAP